MADITHIKSISQSLTLRSAVAIAVALVAGHFSVLLPDGAAQTLASSLIDPVSTLGLLGVAVGRVRAKGPIPKLERRQRVQAPRRPGEAPPARASGSPPPMGRKVRRGI